MFSTRYWIFFLIVLAAISYSMFQLSSANTLITSPQDENKYEYLTLSNGLKVLLVQTPDAAKAAAAVTVDVGSGDDPKGREGLAHFLEHMLFLGRSEEHTSELQSRPHLVCRLLLEKKKKITKKLQK